MNSPVVIGEENKLNKFYKNKKLIYINHPKHLAKDRDKELTKNTVAKAGVLIPKKFNIKKTKDILKLLDYVSFLMTLLPIFVS